MSLASKIVPILCVVVALYAVMDHAVQRATITRSFRALENAEAVRDVGRVAQALQEEQARLDHLCQVRAASDDTAAFLLAWDSRRPFAALQPLLALDAWRYASVRLGPRSLEVERLELLYLCDAEGRVVWGHVEDGATREPIHLRDFPRDRLGLHHPLIARGQIEKMAPQRHGAATRDVDHRAGILLTERGPMLVSSRPVRDAAGAGELRGTVIAGRFLGPRLVRSLSERTHVSFDLWSLDGSPLPPAESRALDEVTSSAHPVLRELDEEVLQVYDTVPDILGAPGLLVRANVQRRISSMGATAVDYALISTVIAGLLMLLVLLGLLQRMVLEPISTLTRNAVAFGRTEDHAIRFDLLRNDEVGILSREFDNVLAKLARSRAELVRTSRAAGMSDIATGILHNVGNVLNSVNVSASMLGRKTRKLCVSDLEGLSRVLAENAEDLGRFVSEDPRGRHLQPYVEALAREMREARAGIDVEIDALSRSIAHVRELIDAQQSYVGRRGVAELVRVEEQIEEALTLSDKALAVDPRLEVVREYGSTPPIVVDRFKLMEILVNLIQNARQAMAESGSPLRRLTLRTEELEECLRIEIIDTGPGIPPENLVQIFNLGFTTRVGGHGVGLHASANAARELSGTLCARGRGREPGATLVLELPKAEARVELEGALS